MDKAIERFLRVNRMDPGSIDLGSYVSAFLEEMEGGLAGRPSSLPMIPTYIETTREVRRGDRVIALDAGGTNMRVAVLSFDEKGAPVIERLTRHRMPGVDAALDREAFFRAMAEAVLPVARASDRIGFCFSYPVEITPEKDGRLIQFTKEIKATGIEGQLVGANLRKALVAVGAPEPSRIVLLNDTVATLLAGRNAIPDRTFSDFIGLVCGTGFNVAYVERNSEIRKTSGLKPAGSQIINTETGSFGRGMRGRVDDGFDATMNNPGKYRFEKTISGAYLGSLALFTLRSAAAEGCLSVDCGRELDRLPSLTTKDLNDFLLYPDGAENPLGAACGRLAASAPASSPRGARADGAPGSDGRRLYELCDAIVERAAAMVAVTLSGVLLKTGNGADPRYPACITVDGTTFWQLRSFRVRVESYMRRLLAGPRARAWEITAVDDAPLLGAAIAALTN